MSVESPWPDIGDVLDTMFEKEYFFHQGFKNDNFLDVLFPPEKWTDRNGDEHDITEQFFGTKMLNIFIVQKDYGFEGDENTWDDPGSEFSQMIEEYVQRWTLQYPRFTDYTTHIYIDLWSAQKVKDENEESTLLDNLIALAPRFEQFCNDTPGFEYKGFIEEQVEANFFEESIKEFYGTPAYKIPDES